MPKATDHDITSPESTGDRGRMVAASLHRIEHEHEELVYCLARQILARHVAAISPTRRSLLAGAAAGAVAAVPAPAAASDADDAELIALCSAFHSTHALVLRGNAGELDDDQFDSVLDRWRDLVDEIGDMRPLTQEGLGAKGRVLQDVLRLRGGSGMIGETFEDTATAHELFAMRFADDVLALQPMGKKKRP
jgi:hypothetical protein